jgi:hypothetical protein
MQVRSKKNHGEQQITMFHWHSHVVLKNWKVAMALKYDEA